jgi:hypothetical protein
MEIFVTSAVYHVDGVIGRMSDVERPGLHVDGSMVEAALLQVGWEFNVEKMFEA